MTIADDLFARDVRKLALYVAQADAYACLEDTGVWVRNVLDDMKNIAVAILGDETYTDEFERIVGKNT